ncbi:LacI family DNA-binding transcriptional regulator [Amycolatopsis sp. NPDC051372]
MTVREPTEPTGVGSRPRPATLTDVARVAGVAPSTVSRAFTKPGRVNAATCEHVLRVAAELG